ncbi:hypothetical protein [Vibrio nomapromontoriensis]|uniref:hypothetical protein n=1 Tax=Vibrio nomapromontoriensis TaxID=2910246 RepID=UPI003D100C17
MMKKRVILPLVAAISTAMVGCGGGGGDSGGSNGPAPTVYKWQVIDVYQDERNNIQNGCAILSKIENSTKVVAARTANTGYRILFHDSKGEFISDKTIEGTSLPSSGIISIPKSDISDGGYVTLEELIGGVAGNRFSYMFSVQKELMQNMTIAIRTPNTHNSCYRGEQELEDITVSDALVAVASNDNPSYYRTSASDGRVSGGSTALSVPVVSNYPAAEKKLVTAFSDYTNSMPNDMISYGILPASSVYVSSMTPPGADILSSLGIDSHSLSLQNLTLKGSQSAIKAVIGNEVYDWQGVNVQTNNYSYVPTDDLLKNWSAEIYAETSIGNWLYLGMRPIKGQPLTLTQPSVTDFSSTNIGSCGSNDCVVSTSFNSNDYTVQRTSIRSKTTNSLDMYQSIYAQPSNNQVLMKSPSEVLAPSVSDSIEIGLVSSTASISMVASYLMENSYSAEDSASAGNEDFTDYNGVIRLSTDSKNHQILMMDETLDFVTNRIN